LHFIPPSNERQSIGKHLQARKKVIASSDIIYKPSEGLREANPVVVIGAVKA
jgi:hypothetical protein